MPRTLALALVIVTAACGSGGRESGAGEAHTADPRQLVLSPRDLARGYEYGDDTGCGVASAAEGDWPALEPLFAEERPNACDMEIQWVWAGEPPYSSVVTSAAYVFRDAAVARRAFAAREELAIFTATLHAKKREPLDLGDTGELLRGDGLNNPASGAVWRDANVVALVVTEPANDAAVRELAKKQQGRLQQLPPPAPKELENDPALQLDDPALALPVYWLGTEFDPPDLPPLELDLAAVGGNTPGRIQLWYGVGGDIPDTVSFDTWEPDAWQRFRRTRLGRLIWDSPCARKKVVQVEGGRAEIFHGYGAPNPVGRPCPKRPRDRVLAHVYYDEVVVAVNMPYCYVCARPDPRPSAYTTVEATETLVRSLRLRTPRR